MLKITVPRVDHFDDDTQSFISVDEVTLELEHSLVSLSKWESIHEKPFLTEEEKTTEEVVSYIQCMCLDPDIPPEVFSRFSRENFEQVSNYINAKQTATWFSPRRDSPNRDIYTSEVIYHLMISAGIPVEMENWHLNRLFTLIKVFDEKNKPAKKMNKADLAARNRELNRARRAAHGTKG